MSRSIQIDTTTPEELLSRQWEERMALVREVEAKMEKLGMEIPARRPVPVRRIPLPPIRDREEPQDEPRSGPSAELSTIDAVREAGKNLGKDWSKSEVLAWLDKQGKLNGHTPSGISSAIQRLRDEL